MPLGVQTGAAMALAPAAPSTTKAVVFSTTSVSPSAPFTVTQSLSRSQNAGRAVVQANTIPATDGSFSQTDDAEDAPTQPSAHPPKRTRIRSHSVSLSSQDRNDLAEKLGVLKTVQLHARSRHAFASSTFLPRSSSETATLDIAAPSRPSLVRRNSTSAPSPPDTFDPSLPAPAVPRSFVRRNSTASSHPTSSDSSEPAITIPSTPPLPPTHPAAPQTIDPPTLRNIAAESHHKILLDEARKGGDFDVAIEAVRKFIRESESPTVLEYNAALEALYVTHRHGEPLHLLLGTYNEMLKHSVVPNPATYIILIDALTARDREIQNSINALESRLKRRKLTGRVETASDMTDKKRIESLQREDNFKPAMSIFSTLISVDGDSSRQPSTYLSLLHSSAARGDVDAATRVFAQMEKLKDKDLENSPPSSPMAYLYLIQAYTNAGGKIGGAEEAFKQYQAAHLPTSSNPQDAAATVESHVEVWNQMIKTYFCFKMPDMAVGLVEQMLGSQADSATAFLAPKFSPLTFTTVLAGFCQMGDVPTALAWFDRLLQQTSGEQGSSSSAGPAMQPDDMAWSLMFDVLATNGMLSDLNRLFSIRQRQSPTNITKSGRLVVFRANMENLDLLDAEQFSQIMDFLIKYVVPQEHHSSSLITELWQAYLKRDMPESAVLLLVDLMNVPSSNEAMRRMQLAFSKQLYEKTQGRVQFAVVLQLTRLAEKLRVIQQEEHIPLFLHSYGLSRAAGTLPVKEMTPRDWELLLWAAVEVEMAATQGRPIHTYVEAYAFEGVVALLGDLSNNGVVFDQMDSTLIQRVIQLVREQHGSDGLQVIFQDLGSSILGSSKKETVQPLVGETSYSAPEFRPDTPLRITTSQTKSINAELWSTAPATAAPAAYANFRRGIENGIAPSPSTIGLLIQNLGRRHLIEELHYAYAVAQAVLRLLDPKKAYGRDSWFNIEDSMVIALAHHGDVEGAHVHRMRILEQGGSPTADAYGALIYHVKDTTDDTSNAMALFNESQRLGVSPNQYLYNNIISKLAKARKADYALELFQQMKATNVQPTSVTYGAVIGACARVGDVQSAESLFAEMASSQYFKPRVPPYNTMMQLYTTTKPNRERALHYYGELRKAKITPSGHTYKVGPLRFQLFFYFSRGTLLASYGCARCHRASGHSSDGKCVRTAAEGEEYHHPRHPLCISDKCVRVCSKGS